VKKKANNFKSNSMSSSENKNKNNEGSKQNKNNALYESIFSFPK
jgi:hypothetical protein